MIQKLEYINIKSPIHKINASLKILYLIFYGILCIVAWKFIYILIASYILVAYLLICSKIPLKYYLINIYKCSLFIVALYIILASYSFSFINATFIVLSFIFGIALICLIIYTTTLFNLSLGIYNIVKNFNLLSVSKNSLFMFIYNLLYLKKDYEVISSNKIDALEIKGINIRYKNIIERFFIKLDLLSENLYNVKLKQQKRKKVMKKNKFELINVKNNLSIIGIIYLLLFIFLIVIYFIKVI